MGCICCPLGNFISSMLYAIERVSTCAACAALVCCMLITIVVACVFGVALGYHFCVVEHNAEAMDRAAGGGLNADSGDLDRRRRSAADADVPLTNGEQAAQPLQRSLRDTATHQDTVPRYQGSVDRRRSASLQHDTAKQPDRTIHEESRDKKSYSAGLRAGAGGGGGRGTVQRMVIQSAPARGTIFKRSIADSRPSLFNSSLTPLLDNVTLLMLH